MKDQPETSTELVTLEASAIVTAFTEEAIDPIIKRIEEEVALHEPDLSTKKGRDAIKSLAHKVARSKTLLDDAGKRLTEEQRKQIDAVNGQRKLVRERLDELKAKTRKPLDDWEASEEERKTAHRERLQRFNQNRTSFDMTSELIQEVLDEVNAIEVDDSWEEFRKMAAEEKSDAIAKFEKDLQAAQVREEQEAKIAQLQKEAAEREEREAAERAEREAKEAAEREAREKAEAIEREKQEAAAKAEAEERERQARIDQEKQDEIQRAEMEQQLRVDRADGLIEYVGKVGKGMIGGEHQPFGILFYELDTKLPGEEKACGDQWPRVQEAINAARVALKTAFDAEQLELRAEADKKRAEEDKARQEAHKAELDAAAEKERLRIEEEKRKEEEARAKRAADEKHRERVMGRALKAMIAYPIEELPQAILDGKIPHVRMEI